MEKEAPQNLLFAVDYLVDLMDSNHNIAANSVIVSNDFVIAIWFNVSLKSLGAY